MCLLIVRYEQRLKVHLQKRSTTTFVQSTRISNVSHCKRKEIETLSEEESFQHVVIDLSIRHVITPVGDAVTICQVDANVPLDFGHEDSREIRGTYSLGRVIEPRKPLRLDVRPFCLILVNCETHYGCFAI